MDQQEGKGWSKMTQESHLLGEEKGAWRSLRSKFFSSGIIVLTTILFTLMLFLPFMNFELDEQIRKLKVDQRINTRKEAETLARLLVFEFSRLQDLITILDEPVGKDGMLKQPESIRKYLWEKVTFNSIIRDIQLLDNSERIHITPYGQDTQEPKAVDPKDKTDIRNYSRITNKVYVSGSENEDTEFVFMPLYIEGNRWGVVKISVSTEEIKRQLNQQIAQQDSFRQLIIFLFIGALLLSSLVGVLVLNLLARKITDPLKTLARNTELFAEKGEVGVLEAIEVENDEVGLLARGFNRMANDISRLLKEKDEAYVQLKASQEQLRQSEKLATLGQLSGGIAHEINNALSPIRLRSEEVLITLDEGGKAESEDLQVILKGIEQCSSIVQKLRDFASPSLGDRAMVDLNGIIRETVALVRRQIEKRQIRLELKLGVIPEVSASAGELEQVFMNMLLNSKDAIEASGKGGTISISTWSGDGAISVEVRDTGTGMDKETVERMFDPFFTTKGVGHGTGLGMSVSFGIIQSHGAGIKVDSTPGKGTAITVRFPMPPKATESSAREQE